MTPASFKAMVEVNQEGCRVWTVSRDHDGYGCTRMNGSTWQAHRAAYVLHVKPISPGAVIHHTCRNLACANPWHLDATSHFEKTMRGISPPACNAAAARGYQAKAGNAPKTVDPQLSLQWGAP